MTPGATVRARTFLVVAIGGALVLPIAWTVLTSLTSSSPRVWIQVFDGPYFGAVKRSFVLMTYVLGLALALGLPLGVLAGTCEFPWKTAGFTCLAVPLFTPTFLWAVGTSSLR